MTDSTTYNGWTNYATWRVNLEICSDLINSYVAECEGGDLARRTALELVSPDLLQEYVEEILMQDCPREESIALSYALSFIADVNWWEISKHAVEEIERVFDNPRSYYA